DPLQPADRLEEGHRRPAVRADPRPPVRRRRLAGPGVQRGRHGGPRPGRGGRFVPRGDRGPDHDRHRPGRRHHPPARRAPGPDARRPRYRAGAGGDERALVSPTPGTTRDPIDTELVFDGVPVVLIDTAGIRRKSSSRDRLERYSLLRGIHAMERADVVLLVVDASAGVLAQDQHVAGYALEAGKGLVIVINKIDLVEPAARKPAYWRKTLAGKFKFATFAPIATVSAKTKE